MKRKKICRILALVLAVAMALAIPVGAVTFDDEGNELKVIVLDPGHGGMDSGTAAKYNGVTVEESKLNWKIADYCRKYLEANYWNVQVLLTRESDVKMSLVDRLEFAEEHNADYMLSIHLNASNGYARGALAMVPRGRYRPEQAAASIATAEAILEQLALLGLTNRGTSVTIDQSARYADGSYVDDLAIVRGCVLRNIPGIIMEHAFLDNAKDYEAYLSTEEKLRSLGIADALGLAQTLGLEPMSMRPRTSSADLGDTPFEDVYEGDWFYDAVTYVWEQGLVQGVREDAFGPKQGATRAMVVTLLYRMDGAEVFPEESSFQDVEPGRWYHAPVEWAVEQGIARGVTETAFAPDRNVTREQFVTFLHRYAGLPAAQQTEFAFQDWDTVGSYARDAMAWAVELGLLIGYTDGTVRPQKELNRAELAVMMHRFHRWLLHERGELIYDWVQSETFKELYIGDSFTLTLTNQYGEQSEVPWRAEPEGVVAVDGNVVTALAEGTAVLSCEVDGMIYECVVEVRELVYEWTISAAEQALYVGESFELKLTNQFEEAADVQWTAEPEGVVSVEGNTVTALTTGSTVLSCEYDGMIYECLVEVTEKVHTWTISHTDVTIKVGESFYLKLKNEEVETADVVWTPGKSGYVTVSGNKITGKAAGTVTVTGQYDGNTYECIVRVKSA